MKEVARPAIHARTGVGCPLWPPPMHGQDCGNLTSDLRVVRFGSVCGRISSGRNPLKEQSLGVPFDVEIEFPLRRRGRGGEHDVAGGRETGPDLPQGRGPDPSRALPGLPPPQSGGAVLLAHLRAGPQARVRPGARDRRAGDAPVAGLLELRRPVPRCAGADRRRDRHPAVVGRCRVPGRRTQGGALRPGRSLRTGRSASPT